MLIWSATICAVVTDLLYIIIIYIIPAFQLFWLHESNQISFPDKIESLICEVPPNSVQSVRRKFKHDFLARNYYSFWREIIVFGAKILHFLARNIFLARKK
jgi:hypothetical protein